MMGPQITSCALGSESRRSARWRRPAPAPFGFLGPWGEVPALIGVPPPSTPPLSGTGVVTFLMGSFLDGPHLKQRGL